MSELVSGQLVGEYRVEGKLGEGTFGKVYAATHPVIGKRAAIKVLNPEFSAQPEMVSRFVSEARAVNQIRHRNIIDIFAFGNLDDGQHYFVMELLEGMTLEDYLQQQGPLPLDRALPIGLDQLTVVHGMGTGRLRDQLLTRLASDPRVRTFHPGGERQTNTGATVVHLR